MSNWCRKYFFKRPSALLPSIIYRSVNTKEFAPFDRGFSKTIKCDESCFSRISALFLSGCPPTIFFGIPLIIINSVQAFALRGITHVRIEAREITPLIGDRYSSSAIVFKGFIIGVKTAIAHSKPYPIYSGSLASTRLPVFKMHRGDLA